MSSGYRRLLNVVLAASLCVAFGGLAPAVARAEELPAEDETIASTEAVEQEGTEVTDLTSDAESAVENLADAEVAPADAEGVVTPVEPEATQVDEAMVDTGELGVTGEEPSAEDAAAETGEPNEAAENTLEVDETSEEAVEAEEAHEEGLAEAEARLMVTASPALLGATATTLDGVDISGHNSRINIANLDADFVIIKATEWNPDKKSYTSYTTGNTGNTYPSYTAQADAALAAGKLIGFYHFVTNPSMGAGWTAQAQGFINAVSGYLGQAILVLDWENTSYSTVESNVSGAKEWLDYVYVHTGVRPLIYMNKSCSQSYNWSSVANAGYELWGAQYADMKHHSGYETNPWQSSSSWGAWGSRPTIFQYSSTTTVTGSGGNVDVNKFYGTRDDWIARCGARELPDEDTSNALQTNVVYTFASLPTSAVVVAASSDNVQLGSGNYLTGNWIATNLGGGLYTFTNLGDGRLLSFADSATRGTNVDLFGALSTWRLIKCSNGAYALRPYGFDNLRLDIVGGKTAVAGTNVQLYSANGTPAQRFFLMKAAGLTAALATGESAEAGVYLIASSKDPSKVLDVKGGSASNGANVQIYGSNMTFAQDFKLEYQGNGLYVIRDYKSGKVLDVAGGKKVNGTNVQQYAQNNTLAQLWYLRQSGDCYVICSAGSGLVLDVAGGKTANGTNVQMYTSNGTDAQRFSLILDKALNEALELEEAGRVVNGGVYVLLSGVAEGKAVDISGGSTSNGANAQIYNSNGTLAQKFEIAYAGNGFYTIQVAKSGKYLDAQGGGTTNGTNVQQYQANGNRAQLWYFVPGDQDGTFVVKSAKSGLALDVAGGKSDNGTNVQLYTANGTAAQSITLELVPLIDDGTYTFVSSLASKTLLALDVKGGSMNYGANVQVYNFNGSAAQRWVVEYQGDGTYIIYSDKSGMALDVSGGSSANGANVQQYTPNGTAAQLWRIGVSNTGGLTFQNVASGKYLDIAGGKTASGANVQQYAGNDTAAQSFTIFTGGNLNYFIDRMIYYCTSANVGYSQGANRYHLYAGGECDCSSLVIGCLKEAGFATGSADSTRDLRKNLVANGWTVMAWNINNVRAGDILICDGYHTCAVVSGFGRSAKIAEAWLNEFGGINGGKAGDQGTTDGLGETRVRTVYQYPSGGGWKAILRYAA